MLSYQGMLTLFCALRSPRILKKCQCLFTKTKQATVKPQRSYGGVSCGQGAWPLLEGVPDAGTTAGTHDSNLDA